MYLHKIGKVELSFRIHKQPSRKIGKVELSFRIHKQPSRNNQIIIIYEIEMFLWNLKYEIFEQVHGNVIFVCSKWVGVSDWAYLYDRIT